MQQTHTLIVGASVSGLAAAACLQQQGIDFLIIEKETQVASPWRNHYERLHLHTSKDLSNLPYKKFDKSVPRYPGRQQVVDYLDAYQKEFGINPVFNTKVLSIKKEGDRWITAAGNSLFASKFVIVATGPYSVPRDIVFTGMETFPGNIMHSCEYKTGKDFTGQKVLVVGFGNSACEIAIDLYEQGALPAMSVRSPVNIIPRDLLGIPIIKVGLMMSRLPVKVADAVNAPVLRLVLGDITKLGLKKMPYGVFEQIQKDGSIPLIDIGTVKHIRQGHIKMYAGIDCIKGKTVYFTDGSKDDFDAIIAAIGYNRNYTGMIDVAPSRFEDIQVSVDKQQYFGKDGLYFCGFWIAPTGQFREIGLDAQKIAKDIAEKEK